MKSVGKKEEGMRRMVDGRKMVFAD